MKITLTIAALAFVLAVPCAAQTVRPDTLWSRQTGPDTLKADTLLQRRVIGMLQLEADWGVRDRTDIVYRQIQMPDGSRAVVDVRVWNGSDIRVGISLGAFQRAYVFRNDAPLYRAYRKCLLRARESERMQSIRVLNGELP